MIVLKSKKDFNQRLIREGFSKCSFAKINGISGATLIQISNGKQYPRPETAKKFVMA
ncbi:XRE family transcriptional regulator [Evansella halocellulosilytica]|uniref:XRE family transcriptional regulator n=1 Tax=Evansella halocellulosilytica TaxID=2011013 RepID=UPI00211D0BC0|nr:XRE family transcriptional regulator [Evansella halocellulosilytica]